MSFANRERANPDRISPFSGNGPFKDSTRSPPRRTTKTGIGRPNDTSRTLNTTSTTMLSTSLMTILVTPSLPPSDTSSAIHLQNTTLSTTGAPPTANSSSPSDTSSAIHSQSTTLQTAGSLLNANITHSTPSMASTTYKYFATNEPSTDDNTALYVALGVLTAVVVLLLITFIHFGLCRWVLNNVQLNILYAVFCKLL